MGVVVFCFEHKSKKCVHEANLHHPPSSSGGGNRKNSLYGLSAGLPLCSAFGFPSGLKGAKSSPLVHNVLFKTCRSGIFSYPALDSALKLSMLSCAELPWQEQGCRRCSKSPGANPPVQ